MCQVFKSLLKLNKFHIRFGAKFDSMKISTFKNGPNASNCRPKNGYIMSLLQDRNLFSSCSQEMMKFFFR